ncbi:unnamed protein product [Bursaphelenchus okinawaensis]|uniref:Beta-lactamase-related domain-containing protein n=1 Tax=Bursaphelenchus okinawaensis TaxID=465554 RepID=A0A811LPR3_9BILA|nr:unnamed protein product [Bursaphelenchus okinawaensis]CAG9127137.1 unnamed protein product [Bursaphelenchus okinawaensis]
MKNAMWRYIVSLAPFFVIVYPQPPPSPWAQSQALRQQTARLGADRPCYPSGPNPPQMAPIATPASMPPPTPFVHSPQAIPGSPIEFPLLNEQSAPSGQVRHSDQGPLGREVVTVYRRAETSLTQLPLQPGPSFTGDLQIAHPPSPHERDWVLATGNETAIDNVLAISLMYGGRLASMGFFYRGTDIFYYAIMHKYSGPVFLKPNPYTYTELMRVARENEEVELGLTQLCGQDNGQGKVTFSTYWEKIPGISFKIWFPGTREAEMQRIKFENEGYRLTSLCGYSVKNRAQYVGVWSKPALSNTPYEAYYGLTMTECLEKDKSLKAKGYVAVQFRVFNNGNDVLCAAIWEYQPKKWHTIEWGTELQAIQKKVTQYSNSLPRSRLPRQVSHYIDAEQKVTYVVLWSDLHSFRYPNPPEIWANKSHIPTTYLPGTTDLLKSDQLEFIVKRVEHFMRDLDIPGLSVAISKNERLKFAAGFGYSNVRRQELVTPMHQFRVGSVSKPITAAAILTLVDQGRLRLDQKVFGPDSLFGAEFSRKKPYGRYVTDLTVRNLLEHTSGGWNNLENDPAWIEPRKPTSELIGMVLESQQLVFKPGKTWIYSNFGYQLLGHIIERISGMSYEQFVKKHVWERVGVDEIQIARPTIAEKSRREVFYYMSGNRVGFNPYEMPPPERTGPWGGWIASPIELLKIMSHLDGFSYRADLLSPWALKEWTKPSPASNGTYGLGWSINVMGFNGWQHDGRMPGSASMLVRLDNGLEMAVVVNKEYSERDFFHELGYILHHIGQNCDWWSRPDVDLFTMNSLRV